MLILLLFFVSNVHLQQIYCSSVQFLKKLNKYIKIKSQYYCAELQKWPHLIDVYVVEVRRVVDGFEEALELAGGSSVDHQDEGDPHRFERVALRRVLVPLDVGVGFTCEAGRGHVYYCRVAEGEGGKKKNTRSW